MKSTYYKLPFLVTGIALIISCKESETTQDTKKETEVTAPDSAVVLLLKKESANKQLSFPAELIPYEKAELYAKVPGYVRSIKVDMGDAVRKGQVLAVIDAPEMTANYAEAQAGLQTARAKLAGTLDAYNRVAQAAKVEGTIAAGEVERFRNQVSIDSALIQAAKSKLVSLAELKSYLVIYAPFNGIVTQRLADVGTLVGTAAGKPLLVVENKDLLRLRVSVPETYSSAAPQTSAIQFTVDAYPGVLFDAKLSRKAGTINLSNRTETWEFLYPNKGNQLKSGMYANAVIRFERAGLSFMVPTSAVATNLEKRFVIRLKNGKTEWVEVRNGISMEDKVEIFGSLTEGDTLLQRASDEIKPEKVLIPKITK